ncbi:hypothetical protein BASA81_017609, partial [Batrachochytrium salamandrivorans]
DQRYDTDRKKIATLGTLLTDKALAWYNPYIEQPEHYAYDLSSWSAFKARMKATFGEINQEQTPLQPSAFSTPPSATQHRSTDDMDVDFARRGPLTPVERQRRMSQRLCLVCGQSGHLKATCPKSNSRFGSQRHVQAIEMEDSNVEMSGNDLGRL